MTLFQVRANGSHKESSLSEENAQNSKMTIVRACYNYRTRQVPNENTEKGVSTIHECDLVRLCGTVEYVSCFMFYVFAFTCLWHTHILNVTERSLHALPRNRAFNFFGVQDALLWLPFERLLFFCAI